MVAAGAISKANADDPKKSSLIRCARTDKGVHAAGNLISLKLIVEDPDVIQKINAHLSPQIRVFGIVRTNGSFSAYQYCDSRIYEYLIPTHCFLPPHPDSFLGKQIVALAEEAGDLEGFYERQNEVLTFWAETEEKYIKPILDELDPSIRSLVMQALYHPDKTSTEQDSAKTHEHPEENDQVSSSDNLDSAGALGKRDMEERSHVTDIDPLDEGANSDQRNPPVAEPKAIKDATSEDPTTSSPKSEDPSPLDLALKSLRTAYTSAKNTYRISPTRLARIRSALNKYIGTHSYHNYTVGKNSRDASANRIIRTFTVAETPITINGTEWLSLKVHGQSFMMHQIRKMVSMAALVVRCGRDPESMDDSFGKEKISIPKAPGLGLLLERPVFDEYNKRLEEYGRSSIDFSIHENEMGEFKQREIYERIWRDEERDHVFHAFFAGIDNLKSSQMLYVSSLGIAATKRALPGVDQAVDAKEGVKDLSSDDEVGGGEEG